MHSGMIGKIDKARRYAEDPSRFALQTLCVTVHGNNSDHEVSFDGTEWKCGCDFFRRERTCAHTMALELMLGQTVLARTAPTSGAKSATAAA